MAGCLGLFARLRHANLRDSVLARNIEDADLRPRATTAVHLLAAI
jgi:hypothetical protein